MEHELAKKINLLPTLPQNTKELTPGHNYTQQKYVEIHTKVSIIKVFKMQRSHLFYKKIKSEFKINIFFAQAKRMCTS